MNETLHRRDRRWQRWALSLGTLLAGVLATAAAWAAQDKVFTAPGADVATPGNLWAFYILGGLTVAGAVATITRRNPVVAAVCLVGTLSCSAGIYVLLHATFMAAMQVLVYAGAIMVLFIFVVMSVERPDEETVGLGHAAGHQADRRRGAGAALLPPDPRGDGLPRSGWPRCSRPRATSAR